MSGPILYSYTRAGGGLNTGELAMYAVHSTIFLWVAFARTSFAATRPSSLAVVNSDWTDSPRGSLSVLIFPLFSSNSGARLRSYLKRTINAGYTIYDRSHFPSVYCRKYQIP